MIYRANTYTSNKYSPQNSVSFGTGNVNLYVDFDNTYCPVSHENLHNISALSSPKFVKYCSNFRQFLNNTRDGLKLHVTTGRTFGEFEAISRLIREKGFELPLPDTFIAKNGSDEYIKIGTDSDFYEKGIFPFSYDKTNIEKEKKIKDLTGWDGKKIKAKLKEIFAQYNLRIVEADSENSVYDYGDKSLFSPGKLPDERNKIFYGDSKADWSVGLRNDGNCKIFVTYPFDMNDCPERKNILDKIIKQINNYFKETNIKTHSYIKQEKKECCGRPYMIFEPLVDESLQVSTVKHENKGLNKLYDAKEALKKAIKDNDLVIVAGDSSNDFDMLNIFQYIDVPKIDVNDEIITNYHSYKKHPQTLVKRLDPENKLHQELIIKKLENLPIIGIVVKNERKREKLLPIVQAFGEGSKYKKIIEVENGHLEDGIRQAIKMYAEKNPKYAKKLSPDLKKEIFGIVDNPLIKNFRFQILTFSGLALGLTAVGGLLLKNLKNKKTQPVSFSNNNMNFIKIMDANTGNKITSTFKDFIVAK